MSKFIPNLSAAAAAASEGEKSDWKIKTASNGLLFYFNTKTKKSQWEKPEVLKTPEERLNSTDWQEHVTADGKTFYYNPKMKQSVWRMPPELKVIKEKQAELRKQTGQVDTQKSGAQKISVSISSSIPATEDNEDDSRRQEGLSHQDAANIFLDLLREKTVPTMKWEQAQQIIKNDERFKVITSFSEQRRLFKEWVNQSKLQERQEYKQRMQKAKESFRRMLEERNILNSDSKYYKVFHLFMNDPRWKALEDRDREQTFQEYLDDLYEREKDDRAQKTKIYREELRKMLTADTSITPLTKWDEICERYKENPVWSELSEYDKLQVFSKWIIELDRQEHDERRKQRRYQERKNREGFRELLKEHIERGTLTHKTKWRHFVHVIKEDKRLLNMLGQSGSTPRELFEDQIEHLKDQYKRTKDDLKKILKEKDFKITSETPFKDFDTTLEKHDEYKGLDAKTREFFFNYFTDKAKAKEKESQKKYKKILKKYDRFLKTLNDIKADSEFKNFEKAINENEQFASLKEADKISHFENYIQELKNQDEGQISDVDMERAKKKKNKRKRKNKKKNYESSGDEHAKGDSSDESYYKRSESRSRSRTPSKDRKKKAKKEKKRGGKRSPSESGADSDMEKKVEKKVHLEKNEEKEAGEQEKGKDNVKNEEMPEKEKMEEDKPAPSQVQNQEANKPAEESKQEVINQEAGNQIKGAGEEAKLIAPKPSEVENKAIEVGKVEEHKEDQEEREEGETKESVPRLIKRSLSKSSRSRSRSGSRERTKKKKDRKHSKKKGKKSEKKGKKKHKKRSYTPSESSDED